MKRMIVALAMGAAACSPSVDQAQAEPQKAAQAPVSLPDQTAVRTAASDGKPTLAGWSATPAPKGDGVLRYSLHIEPDNKAFAGAKAFSSAFRETDAVAAAKKAAGIEGFETTKVLAQAKVKQAAMDRLEKGSWATSVMLEGRMLGRPARFIGTVWYGAHGEPDGKAAAGVSGFAAPEPAFVALGGYAVPAILFSRATATPGTVMSTDGAEPPQKATQLLSDLFAQWTGTLSTGGDNLSALNGIMQGNLGVKSGTGCINMPGCVGGGLPPVRTPNY